MELPTQKLCNRCKVEKPLSEFYTRETGKTRTECKTCFRSIVLKNYHSKSVDLEWMNSRNTRHRELYGRHDRNYNNPEARADRIRNWTLLREFGIDLQDYNILLEIQTGTCAICKQLPTGI